MSCLTAFVAVVLAAGEEWRELPPMATPRQEVGVAALDGKVYVMGGLLPGGEATLVVERFDVSDERWESVAPLLGDAGLHHVGAAAVGGRVYAIGGLINPTFAGVSAVNAYDPGSGEWEPRADLLTARGAMGVATLNGRIYAAGGQSRGSLRDFAVYDPELDRWAVLSPLPSQRNHLVAVGLDGFLYAIGGRTRGLLGVVERYDPAGGDSERGAWETVAELPTPRAGIAAAVASGRLHVFGGEGNSLDPLRIFDENESFDVETGRWTTRCPLPVGLHGMGAAEVGGVLYLAGGADKAGFAVSPVVYAYTPPPRRTFPGDVNGDHGVDLADVGFLLLRTLFPPPGVCADRSNAADVNADGARNLLDVLYLLDFLFRDGPPPGAAD